MAIVWRPTREVLEQANVVRLMLRLGFDDFRALQRFSAEEPERFWPAAIEDMGLEFSRPWDRVVDLTHGPEWATWFIGGKLNLAWNCVHRWAERTPDVAAALWESEDGERHGLSYRELSSRVTRFAEALVALGVRAGDRVAFFLPMSPEVSIVSHACAHIGAVQVPIFSGFAAPAVAQRLQDSEAKVVVTADGSLRRGREVPMKEIVDDAVRESPSVEHVVVWRRLGRELVERHDLSSLRVLVTTGEPWNPEPYRWLHEVVGDGRCPIINCSGGTEVGACFLSPTVATPIKACSLGGPALGMAMDVVDAEGRPVRGEVGELVCRKPFPGMTRGFWRDPERYLDTYWRRLPGIWVHGDWASVDEDGYWFLHGRSDDTLNIAGKRVGPAELESAVVAHPAVAEAAAVGVPH